MDGFSKEVLWAESYADIYGIVDLDNTNDPMALVSYTNADTLGDLGPIAEVIHEYRVNNIHGLYGLSLNEYFDTPYDVSRLLLSRARVEREDEAMIAEQQRREMEDQMKKNKLLG